MASKLLQKGVQLKQISRISVTRSLSSKERSSKESTKNQAKTSTPKGSTKTTVPKSSAAETSYTSKATPIPPQEPVGPGASKSGEYKNPEYYCYNGMSYFDLEAEMMKDRLPQPKSGNEQF